MLKTKLGRHNITLRHKELYEKIILKRFYDKNNILRTKATTEITWPLYIWKFSDAPS